MGKRSERFSGKKLYNCLETITGQEAQIILWDGLSFFGDIIEASKDSVKIRDKNARWYNQKAHIHKLELDAIREIVLDTTSKW